ncbi:hypothetical protein EYV94_16955 [Puteibacter caeruleilacunae]|nr:hypothetical protein EYV94_16955 [Puteibacter caeruleilacunae]
MNKQFSFKRFVLLLKQEAVMNNRFYLTFFSVLTVSCCILMFFAISGMGKFYDEASYVTMMLFFGTIGGLIYGTSAFQETRSSDLLSGYLSQPGSILEKYLVQFAFKIILFFPILLLSYWIASNVAWFAVDATLIKLTSIIPRFSFSLLFDPKIYPVLSKIHGPLDVFVTMLSTLCFAFAGSIFFDRYKLFKTTLLVAGLYILDMVVKLMLTKFYFPVYAKGLRIKVNEYESFWNLYNTQWYHYLVGLGGALILLFFVYYKLKEKEA